MTEYRISPKISNAELQRDIDNTRKETEAYKLLAKGFSILKDLPENSTNNIYTLQAYAQAKNAEDCGLFLIELEGILAERMRAK